MEVIREGRTKQINETSQVKFNLQHKMQGDIFSSVKLNMKLLQILLAHAVFIIFCFKFISIFFKRYMVYMHMSVWLPAAVSLV